MCNHYGILAIDAVTTTLFQYDADIVDEPGMWSDMRQRQLELELGSESVLRFAAEVGAATGAQAEVRA